MDLATIIGITVIYVTIIVGVMSITSLWPGPINLPNNLVPRVNLF